MPLALVEYLTAIFAVAVTLGRVGEATKISPKVFIIDYYNDEENAWHGIPEFDLLAQNISVPGLSVRYPQVHCTVDGSICQMTTDEAEINAATSAMALVLSPVFDLSKTYFLLAGDGGISPKVGTLASVVFAQFSVQVALQYEIDSRERPSQFSTGYIPQGTTDLGVYPGFIYGTEVFQLNDALRQRAISFAQAAALNDSDTAQAYRELYAGESDYAPALGKPSIIACDTATSDVWWSGDLLGSAFENTTKLFTNGTGEYCMTAQEDSAVLEALLRGHVAHLTDFSRAILMRTASDFDRPAPNMSAADNLFNGQNAGYDAAVLNVHLAGVKVVQGIIAGWEHTFREGIRAQNYIGDILGSLGGNPGFGPGSQFGGNPAPSP